MHNPNALKNSNSSSEPATSLSMSTSSSSSCSYSSLSCLSPWCAGSAVFLTLLLAVLALVLAEAALYFKNKSVSLQHFSPSATSALLDFSLILRSPLVSLHASIHFFFFASLISVNLQLPTTTQTRSTRFIIEIHRRHCFILPLQKNNPILKNAGRLVLFQTMHVFATSE